MAATVAATVVAARPTVSATTALVATAAAHATAKNANLKEYEKIPNAKHHVFIFDF